MPKVRDSGRVRSAAGKSTAWSLVQKVRVRTVGRNASYAAAVFAMVAMRSSAGGAEAEWVGRLRLPSEYNVSISCSAILLPTRAQASSLGIEQPPRIEIEEADEAVGMLSS